MNGGTTVGLVALCWYLLQGWPGLSLGAGGRKQKENDAKKTPYPPSDGQGGRGGAVIQSLR